MPRSTPAMLLRHLAVDVLGAILYFPVWWYSVGFLEAAGGLWAWLGHMAEAFGLRHWIRNLFRPMYGLHDWQGRLISFFVRLAAIAWYSLVLALLALVSLMLLVAYLLWPLAALAGLWQQFAGGQPTVILPL